MNPLNSSKSHSDVHQLCQQRWLNAKKSFKALEKIANQVGINLIQRSAENIQRLRMEMDVSNFNPKVSSQNNINVNPQVRPNPFAFNLFPDEKLFFRCFQKIEFTFSHGTIPINTPSILKAQCLFSKDELARRQLNDTTGLTGTLDEILGNTDYLYGVLGTKKDRTFSKFPDLFGDEKDVFTFMINQVLKTQRKLGQHPFSVRASDWFWFQSARELDPIYLGKTLRRVIHHKTQNNIAEKVYLYEDPDGKTSSFKVLVGEEEFLGDSFKKAFALMILKELRMADPEFRQRILAYFNPDKPAPYEQQKEVGIILFHYLYSPEVSIPVFFPLHQYTLHTNPLHGLETLRTYLHDAVKENDLKTVSTIVNQHPSLIDCKNQEDQFNTPLMTACVLGHFDIVKFLLSKGADTSLKNKRKFTALMLATLNGHLDIVQLLLTYPSSSTFERDLIGHQTHINAIVPMVKNKEGRWANYQTALTLAAKAYRADIVDTLLKHGARPRNSHVVVAIPTFIDGQGERYFLLGQKCYQEKNPQNPKNTTLVAYGDWVLPGCLKEETVQDSVEAAVRNLRFLTNIDSQSFIQKRKATAQMIVNYQKLSDHKATNHSVDFVLIDFGQYQSSQSLPPNLTPSSTGHLLNLEWKTVKDMQLQKIPEVGKRYTLLNPKCALKKDYIKASNAMIMHAIDQAKNDRDQVLHFLNEKDFNLANFLETEGVENLHSAIFNGDIQQVKKLVNNHIPVEGKAHTVLDGDLFHYTPLMQATEYSQEEIANFLLSQGASSNLKSSGLSPLEIALNLESNSLIELLFQYGAKLDDTSEYIQIGLARCIENKNKEAIEIILSHSGFNLLCDDIESIGLFFDFFTRDENQNLFALFLQKHPQKGIEEPTNDAYQLAAYAIENNRPDTLEMILNHLPPYQTEVLLGLSLLPTQYPFSLIHFACQNNATASIKLLAEKGAAYCLTEDQDGKTALTYVEEHQNQEAIAWIKKYSISHQIERKTGIFPKKIYHTYLEFNSIEEAMIVYKALRKFYILCDKPSTLPNLCVDKESLMMFIEDKMLNSDSLIEEPAPIEVTNKLQAILKENPSRVYVLKEKYSYSSQYHTYYEIYFDQNVNVEMLSLHLQSKHWIYPKYCPYDQTLILNDNDFNSLIRALA